MQCISPPHRPGTVFLDVQVNGVRSTRTTASFTFQPEATILSVSPRSGSHKGGTVILFHGHHFVESSVLRCRFGAKETPGLYVDGRTLRCVSPPHDGPETVSVSLTFNGEDFVSGGEYTFVLGASVTWLDTTTGPALAASAMEGKFSLE